MKRRPSGVGRKRRSQLRNLLGDSGGAAGGSSLVEHVCHQIGQAGLVRWIRAIPGAHHHLDPDQRQLVRLRQEHVQAVFQAKPLHPWHPKGVFSSAAGSL